MLFLDFWTNLGSMAKNVIANWVNKSLRTAVDSCGVKDFFSIYNRNVIQIKMLSGENMFRHQLLRASLASAVLSYFLHYFNLQ